MTGLARRLDEAADIAGHLDRLAACDGRLGPVIAMAGPVVPRRVVRGFEGLARIVCGQQLSVASAKAIWERVQPVVAELGPRGVLGAPERFSGLGLSAPKLRTISAVAQAIADGALDLDRVADMDADAARLRLCAVKGIGPWTADVYLLFAEGHPDIFPVGDLALQKAVAHGLSLHERPDGRALEALTAGWAPHGGAAALMFWRYFAAVTQKEGTI